MAIKAITESLSSIYNRQVFFFFFKHTHLMLNLRDSTHKHIFKYICKRCKFSITDFFFSDLPNRNRVSITSGTLYLSQLS